jgi:uncharacterized protein YjiS (DUF1127 family)
MNQIDREMEQIGHRPASAMLLSSIATFASPLHGALAPGPLAEPWLPRAWRGLFAALEHAADVVWTWHERTKTRRQLAMLDDRLLKDIGITRLDARSEAEKPFWRV